MSNVVHNFTERQVSELAKRGISPEQALAAGALPVLDASDMPNGTPEYWDQYLPGMLFPWRSPTPGTPVQWQLKPDTPVVKDDGTTAKYLFPAGFQPVLHAIRENASATKILIVEGTHQTIAADLWADPEYAVYGISGCFGWVSEGLPTVDLVVCAGRDVVVVLDADAATNRMVYDAGVMLKGELEAYGAPVVRFARVTGGARNGLDDVLAARPVEHRTSYVDNLVAKAYAGAAGLKPADSKPKPPTVASRRESGDAARFFDQGALLVKTLSEAIRETYPAALTAEHRIAVYQHGVFGIDGTAFLSAVTELLGEEYASAHRTNAEQFTVGQLAASGVLLPDRMGSPVLNVANGMLDLRTGLLGPHDPAWCSTVQLPVEWDPGATSPVYDAWLAERVGTQAEDLEETISTMLDPSTTPSKAVFLFGPARSGKSTLLRIMAAMMGVENVAGVSLHQLAENQFAAANVYGKALNVSADLSPRHVEDMTLFKMLTGEDLILGNRKYGQQFSFTNRALFAFSANTLPTVGEASRAYVERIKPFEFPDSFAGRVDEGLEPILLAELPGILVRWVRAWQRRAARGGYAETDPAVRERFEIASDRVAQFLRDATRAETPTGAGSFSARVSTGTQLYAGFKDWAAENGGHPMSRRLFLERLRSSRGVSEGRNSSRVRVFGLKLLPRKDWGDLEGRAEWAETPHPAQDGEKLFSEVDHEENVFPQGGSYGPDLPALPATEPAENVNKTDIPVDDVTEQTERVWADVEDVVAARYTSLCDQGHQEVVVDGLWYACPICNPETIIRRQP